MKWEKKERKDKREEEKEIETNSRKKRSLMYIISIAVDPLVFIVAV